MIIGNHAIMMFVSIIIGSLLIVVFFIIMFLPYDSYNTSYNTYNNFSLLPLLESKGITILPSNWSFPQSAKCLNKIMTGIIPIRISYYSLFVHFIIFHFCFQTSDYLKPNDSVKVYCIKNSSKSLKSCLLLD